MNTQTKQIAQERHRYMEGFLAVLCGMGRRKVIFLIVSWRTMVMDALQ
jgi:hypothetical protein